MESTRSSSNKWTKIKYQDVLHRIVNFFATVLNIFSKEIISSDTKRRKRVLNFAWNTWKYWWNETADGEILPVFSLRSKRSRTKRTKFGQRVLVFRIRDARKMGREQKGGRKGVGEGKEGNAACPQTPRFWKTRSPTNGAPDWCGVVILIDKCIKLAWMIPVIITRAWLAYVISDSFSTAVLIIDRTWRSNRSQRTLIVLYGNLA